MKKATRRSQLVKEHQVIHGSTIQAIGKQKFLNAKGIGSRTEEATMEYASLQIATIENKKTLLKMDKHVTKPSSQCVSKYRSTINPEAGKPSHKTITTSASIVES